ncbi:MAG: VanZ family protein [Clostridia bacterium]|nr:VanZ family protein [Clostridia bacterium]
MCFGEMSKGRKVYTVILCVLFFAMLGFIFGHSLVPESESAKESGAVYGALEPVIKAVFGESFGEELLRKAAHFGEFCVLGVITSLIFISFKKYSLKNWFLLIAFGLAVGFIDETLQAIVKRGAMITDVWIDGGGFFTALILVGGIFLLVNLIKNRKKAKSGYKDE